MVRENSINKEQLTKSKEQLTINNEQRAKSKEQLTNKKGKKFNSNLSSVHCSLFTVLCPLFSVHYSLFTVLCSLFFVSCQTAPVLKTPEAFLKEGVIPLDKNASVYLITNVNESKSIINQLPIKEIKDSYVRQMIDKSNYAVAALFPQKSGKRFQITAWGNYPKSSADMALGSNSGWKKAQNGNHIPYWHSSSENISLGISAKNLFVASSLNSDPADPFAAGAVIPEGFSDFSRGSVLSLWVNNPASMLQQVLDKAKVPLSAPVNQLFINLHLGSQAQKQYEAVIRLGFENAAHARGLAAILNIAGAFTSSDPAMQIATLLLSNRPVQTDRFLDIKVNFTREAEIIRLITSLAGMVN